MRAKKSGQRDAVILLVVLGMLSLLSLLAVTFVVSSGQSRTSSLAMAHRDFHQTPHDRLLDQGLRQILRGTTDRRSAAWKNDLLGDLYGSSAAQDTPTFLTARIQDNNGIVLRDNPERVKAFQYYVDPPLNTFTKSSPEAAEFYGTGSSSNFLKIPLTWPNDTTSTILQKQLPEQSDAWNGRVVTFLEGPLANQSLRIVRYVGEVDLVKDSSNNFKLNPERANLQYSITVDLADVKDIFVTVKGSSGTWQTKTVSDWSQISAAALLYEDYTNTTPALPYRMMINAAPNNSYGLGYDLGATSATTTPAFSTGSVFNSVFDSYLPHHAFKGGTYSPAGDTDEPYDAADYQNFFLALKQAAVSGSDASDDIIPSFHRPAVINYLMKGAISLNNSGLTYSDIAVQDQFKDFLAAVGRATARPLSYNIKSFPGGLSNNPQFSGSSSLSFGAGLGARSPQLVIDWSQLPDPGEQAKFEAWQRWLTRGPWDVDNDSEGTRDSVWVDLNYPLMTSPEGKLLKILCAFYIEDMDGKLDLNAAGGWAPTAGGAMGTNSKYAYSYANSTSSTNFDPGQWPQGLGYGTAEISLRPAVTTDAEYGQLVTNRYSSSATGDDNAGVEGASDGHSALLERNRDNQPSAYTLRANGYFKPKFPLAVRGYSGLGLDLLGNPILVESSTLGFGETVDDPYDARVLFHDRFDNHFSLAEYQRLARFNDLDRSGAPRRLQATASTAFTPSYSTTAAYVERIRSISPRNVSLTLPRFAVNYQYPRITETNPLKIEKATRRVSSFVEFVEAFAQNKPLSTSSPLNATPPAPYFNATALSRLFPIEFMQNRPLNLNRPLGDGQDNNANGLIDEASEVVSGQLAQYPAGQNATQVGGSTKISEEYIRDAVGFDTELEAEAAKMKSEFGGNQPKQLLARHLYCLAQLILPADYRFPNQPDPTTTVAADVRARILAQWAVNVVDFRDPDSAMTRFAYDATPFTAKSGVYWVPADGVVWGVEQTELVMTETLAFHDMRIRKKPNSDPAEYQQLRVPQGSLFMEFLCPRTLPTTSSDTTLPPAMYGLYKLNSGVPALDLGGTVEDPPMSATNLTNTSVFYPKWRVAFLKPSPGTTSGYLDAPSKAYERSAKDRFHYTYQVGGAKAGLKWFTGSGTADPAEPEIDRIMWFADLTPTSSNHAWPSVGSKPPTPEDKIFRWTAGTGSATPLLGGGQYLIVAPREFTYLGSKKQSGGAPKHMPSNHRFQVMNNWLQIWGQENDPAPWPTGVATPYVYKNGAQVTPTQPEFAKKIRDCVTMTAGMNLPADWEADKEIFDKSAGLNTYIGLNVSEPTRDQYYTKPDYYLNKNDTTVPSDNETNASPFKNMSKDAYIDLSDDTGTPPSPLDMGANGYLKANGWSGSEYPDIKTEPHWSAAMLQRLADPLRPYHEIYNPYITVDWMPIDLTVFSGEETLSPSSSGKMLLASRHKTGATLGPKQDFAKAGENTATSPLAGVTFYSFHNQLTELETKEVTPTTPVHFEYELDTEVYAGSSVPADPRKGEATFSTMGYLNPRFVIRGTWNLPPQTPPPNPDDYENAMFLGAPGPNPWATESTLTISAANAKLALKAPLAPYFPNREFVNAFELANVPLSSPGQFFQEFSGQVKDLKLPRFPYTLDFEDLLAPTGGTYTKSSALLLECVGVPSPWGDSWKVIHPDAVRSGKTLAQTHLFENYRAPYNTIPTFIEPGKINLNTATEATVYRGLMWNIMTPAKTRATAAIPYLTTLLAERQGYTTSKSSLTLQPNPHLNNDFATEFAKLFTSPLTPDKFPEASQQVKQSFDVGVLRHRTTLSGTPGDRRVFEVNEPGVFPDDGSSSGTPTGWKLQTSIPLNSFTHSYPAARMANLTTDRSNVFAIRMTLGYFECDTTGAIGAEYGAEQGRAKRHRAYYLIDRSIPVGYQTGRDMNVENCVLLRSVIE